MGFDGSISTKIGFRPALITAKAVEQYVIAGIITSDPFGKFNIFNEIVKASVPLAHPIAYFALQISAKDFQKFKESEFILFEDELPNMYEIKK